MRKRAAPPFFSRSLLRAAAAAARPLALTGEGGFTCIAPRSLGGRRPFPGALPRRPPSRVRDPPWPPLFSPPSLFPPCVLCFLIRQPSLWPPPPEIPDPSPSACAPPRPPFPPAPFHAEWARGRAPQTRAASPWAFWGCRRDLRDSRGREDLSLITLSPHRSFLAGRFRSRGAFFSHCSPPNRTTSLFFFRAPLALFCTSLTMSGPSSSRLAVPHRAPLSRSPCSVFATLQRHEHPRAGIGHPRAQEHHLPGPGVPQPRLLIPPRFSSYGSLFCPLSFCLSRWIPHSRARSPTILPPLQILVKSSKMIPIMLIGTVLFGKARRCRARRLIISPRPEWLCEELTHPPVFVTHYPSPRLLPYPPHHPPFFIR